MSEDTADVSEEVVSPEEEAHGPSHPPLQESDADRNWKQMREKQRELERRIAFYEDELAKKKEPEEVEDPNDLVDRRSLQKALSRLEGQLQQQKLEAVPDRLRSKYNDFDQVVSEENVLKLKETEPELFTSLSAGKDPYAVGVAAYKMLKSTGIAKPSNDEMKAQVAANAKKPVSSNAIKGQGALHEANAFAALTPERKAALYKEMQSAIRSR